jgi:hypothetical protein
MKQRTAPISAILVIVAGTAALLGLSVVLRHLLGDYSYPWGTAIGGSILLAVMTYTAARRSDAREHPAFIAVFLGVLFLVVSDLWLLLRKL